MQIGKVLGLASMVIMGGLVGGCSTVQVHPVTVAQVNNPAISGVRFFQPAPYLLVTQLPMHPQPMMMIRNGPGPRGPQGRHGPMAMRDGWKHGHGHFHAMHQKKRGPHGKREHGRMKHHGPWMMPPMAGHPMPPMMAPQRVLCLQIIYLPDYSHPYVADLTGGLGHSKNSIVLANGWELLGINAKGHLTEPPPVRAITAMSGPMGGPMHGPMAWQHQGMAGRPHMMHGRHGRKMAHHRPMMGRGGMKHHPMNHKRMMWRMRMMHRMMMSRQAAMAMGLHPGLYRFVFNAKTGQLKCLVPVKFMRMAHHGHFHGGWKAHKKWNKKWHKAHPAAAKAAGS